MYYRWTALKHSGFDTSWTIIMEALFVWVHVCVLHDFYTHTDADFVRTLHQKVSLWSISHINHFTFTVRNDQCEERALFADFLLGIMKTAHIDSPEQCYHVPELSSEKVTLVANNTKELIMGLLSTRVVRKCYQSLETCPPIQFLKDYFELAKTQVDTVEHPRRTPP